MYDVCLYITLTYTADGSGLFVTCSCDNCKSCIVLVITC